MEAGANVLVAGSAVYGKEDIPAAIAALWHNVTGPMLATVFQNWRDDDEKASFFDRMEAACKTPAKPAAAE